MQPFEARDTASDYRSSHCKLQLEAMLCVVLHDYRSLHSDYRSLHRKLQLEAMLCVALHD